MGYENFGRLVDHWLNYAPFRAAMRQDATKAVQQTGIPFTPQELELISKTDWSLSDTALQERITKLFG